MKLQTEPILIPGNKLGIKLDFPEQFLDKAQSPYSRNIEYVDGILAGRGGLTKFDTTQLPGSVMLMEQFYLFDGASYFMVCTNKDVTYYDFTNTRFVFLDPVYTTGLAKIGTGTSSAILTGSGTTWMTNASAGDYFKIGTGNLHSECDWYEIVTVDTGTQITLTSGNSSYLKLLCNFDGSDGATAFTDPIQGAATFAGNAQLDTAQKKFGAASLLLDGTGDYISYADSDDWYWDGDITIDCWVRFNALPTDGNDMAFVSQDIIGSSWNSFYLSNTSGSYYLNYGYDITNTFSLASSALAVSTGTWYHFAVTRSGNAYKLFFNGTVVGSGTASGFPTNMAKPLYIGGGREGTASLLNGWIDEVRISKGIAIWTSGFYVPTSAYSQPISTSFQDYTIRRCFSGATGSGANYWFSTVFQDKNLGETWIGTNGVDNPVRWSATGQVSNVDLSDVSGLTTAKFVSQFKDRLFWAYTTEGAIQPQRIRWSAVADCETYTATDFEDFMEDQAWLTGMVEFSNYFAIMKERGARIGRYVGGDYTFDFEVSTVPVGCYAPNSICSNSDSIYYYGIDNKFHRWNFLREEDISIDILPWTKDFDPNMEQFVFGWEVEWKNQIRWFVPHGSTSYNNHVVVYDYAQDIIEIWDTAQTQALSCIGEYVRNADIFCDDSVEGEKYADEVSGYADSRTFLDGAPTLVYGGYDGYLRKADSGYDDDGTDYTRKLRTKRLDFRYPVMNKRLWKQEWAFNTMTTGNVTLYLKKGDNEIDDTAIKTIALTSDTKDVIRPKVTWDKEDYTFQFELQSTDHFELIGFLNYWFGKGKEFR